MDSLFGSLKRLIKLDNVTLDNNVFRLHYKATVIFLLAFSVLVTSKQYIGEPIDCISRDDIPIKLLNTFCWIHTTFSIDDAWNKKVGSEIPYPGVDKAVEGQKRTYHAYYQWVCFVLFLQAIMFYIPRYLWKMWEGGRVRHLLMDLNSPIMTQDAKDDRRRLLVDYFVVHLGNHCGYSFQFFLCEIANFVNVIGQMYLVDRFLGGEFSTYGVKVLQFSEWDWVVRYDPMIKVFPRLSKCTFHKYGSSGDVQKHDAMCILPINIINEKIYVFLWFWFVILAVLTGIMLLYRVAILFWPQCRMIVLRSRARFADSKYLETVFHHSKIGDWFILDLLCKNMDPRNFADFIQDFARAVDRKKADLV